MDAQDGLLNVKQVAELLNVSVRTVWAWSAGGTMPKPITVGRVTKRWRPADIQAYMERGAHATSAPASP